MNHSHSIFERLECRSLMSAVTAASDPGAAFNFEGMAYFVATDGLRGPELWRTDGTEAGTSLFLETTSGPGSQLSVGSSVSGIEYHGQVYFTIAGYLWRSDGTQVGTVKVSEQKIGWSRDPVIFNDRMYYVANGPEGVGIYRSDGTTEGTTRISSIIYGDILGVGSQGLVISGRDAGTIVYPVNHSIPRAGTNIYVSNGTHTSKTNLSVEYTGSIQSAQINGKVVLTLNISTNRSGDVSTYVSDGSLGGTVSLKAGEVGRPQSLGDKAILHGGTKVLVTDGTPEGTVEIADLSPLQGVDLSAESGGIAYFYQNAGTRYLAASDGTPQGTVVLPLPADAMVDEFLGSIGADQYFAVNRAGQSELWRSDGSVLGTQFVTLIPPHSYRPSGLGDQILFRALSPDFSTEPYITDGTAGGTHLLKDINTQPLLEAPTVVPGQSSYTSTGGTIYYSPFVQLEGNAPAGATVVLFNDDDELGRVIADANGHYLFTPSAPLPGNAWVFANVAAANGDVSPVENRDHVLYLHTDATLPRATITFMAQDGTHHVHIEFSEPIDPTTFATADVVLENLTTGQTIAAEDLLLTPQGADNKVFRLTLADEPNGIFPDADYRLTLLNAGITDRVGNEMQFRAPLTWTVQPLSLVTLRLGVDNGTSPTDQIVATRAVSVRGTARVGARVSIYVNGEEVAQRMVSSNGSFSNSIDVPGDGAHLITATATLDGVTSPVSAPLNVVVDTTAPAVSGMQFVAPGTIKVTFNENVNIQADSLTLIYAPTGQAVSSDHIQLVFDNATHTATFTVTSPLAVGKYLATLALGSIQDNGAHTASGVSSLVFSNPGSQTGQQAVFSNRTLRVTGTSLDDRILVRRSPSNALLLEVLFNNQAAGSYAMSQIDLIQIDGGAGNDRIELIPDVWTASKLYGGAGHDTIIGGLGTDRMYGGDGNDLIGGFGGNDILYGEAGNDRLFGGEGRDYIVGGLGADLIRGENGIDQIVAKNGEDDYRGNAGDVITLVA